MAVAALFLFPPFPPAMIIIITSINTNEHYLPIQAAAAPPAECNIAGFLISPVVIIIITSINTNDCTTAGGGGGCCCCIIIIIIESSRGGWQRLKRC